jgi:glycosyltransferase involved in cell wall biosynthesis
MNAWSQAEARGIQQRGGRVIFDANVNYYRIWGDYFVPGTRPTAEQQRDAIAMTTLADWVVADSSYLAAIVREITPRVTWVPDNVDLSVFAGVRAHAPGRRVRIVWSGVSKKAAHLREIRDVLADVPGIELVLVSDAEPSGLGDLTAQVPCEVFRYSNASYARILEGCDIIVSPKRLVNGYEMAHTEYKITLGMAAGLPAVASPQQSYVEAMSHLGGGIVATTPEDWRDALRRLASDPGLRAAMGQRARETVRQYYSTDAVAPRYLEVLTMVCPALGERQAVPLAKGVR